MYIESGSVRHWNSHRLGAVNVSSLPRHSDASSKHSQWNTIAVRNKMHRLQVVQPRVTNTPDSQYSTEPNYHSLGKHISTSSFVTSQQHTTRARSLDRTDDILQTQNINGHDSNFCHSNRAYKSNSVSTNVFYASQTMADSEGPRPLPLPVALRIKERFEKRVLHKHSLCLEQEFKRTGKSTVAVDRAGKYQLVAAFLVNGGLVEAWHVYSAIPVEINPASNEEPSTRTIELTQRRLRLLQRYYSGARQYVVLYMNSNHAEHYLPMGLASSQEYTENPIQRKATFHTEIHHGRNSVVARLLSSFSLSSRFPNSEGNLLEVKEKQCTQRSSVTDLSVSSENSKTPQQMQNKMQRDHSLPSPNLDEQIIKTSAGREKTNVARPKSFQSFFRRMWNHVSLRRWSPASTRSAENLCSRGEERKHSKHEKDSSSSGVVDYSFTTGSSISDQVNGPSNAEKSEDQFLLVENNISQVLDKLNRPLNGSQHDSTTDLNANKPCQIPVWIPKQNTGAT